MRRLIALSLICASCAAVRAPADSRFDAEIGALLRPVLAYELARAREDPEGLPLCVRRAMAEDVIEWPPFQPLRPDARWVVIAADNSDTDGAVRPEVNAAANAAGTAGYRTRARRVAPAWVARPVRLGGSRRRCGGILTFVRPSFNGDLAFVPGTYSCGGDRTCGGGFVFALRREGGAWRLFAMRGLWVI
jgi:hypothetical protein